MDKYHILIIEDDPAVAESLHAGLAREGFAVNWKPTGADGMAFAQKYSPHVVLLDIRLPDGSGNEFRLLSYLARHRGQALSRAGTTYSPGTQTVAVTKCDVQQTFEVLGVLSNISETQILMPVDGNLSQILVRAGNSVSAGQVLARLHLPSHAGSAWRCPASVS